MVETRSKRRAAALAPAAGIPPTSHPTSTAGPSSAESSPTYKSKRRRANPLSSSSVPSIPKAEHASQDTWEARKAQAESRIDQYKPADRKNEQFLVNALKAALTWLPEGGRELMAGDIISVDDDDDILYEVYENFRTAVVDAVKSTAKTPVTPSPHRSRRFSVDSVDAELPEPQTRSSTWAEACEARDGHRCPITGALSEKEWERQGEEPGKLWGKLEVHHIVPFSLAGFDEKDSHDAAIKWSSIYTAFPKVKTITASKINTAENGITIYTTVHIEFQAFRVALEPIETQNSYRVKQYRDFSPWLLPFCENGQLVTLQQATGHSDKPLPNREFLDMHFRLCEIFHASGFAEEAKMKASRWEQIKKESRGRALEEDGSTNISELLEIGFACYLLK